MLFKKVFTFYADLFVQRSLEVSPGCTVQPLTHHWHKWGHGRRQRVRAPPSLDFIHDTDVVEW